MSSVKSAQPASGIAPNTNHKGATSMAGRSRGQPRFFALRNRIDPMYVPRA
jgi:hypothetical protein